MYEYPSIIILLSTIQFKRIYTMDKKYAHTACCFTGHRKINENIFDSLLNLLEIETEKLIMSGIKKFYCGGALGFDIMAAQIIIKLKNKYPDIKLILTIPYINQSKSYLPTEKLEYDFILSKADETICLSDHYYRGCMHVRNRYMVDHSSHCICFLEKLSSGTYYTVKYAQKNNLTIINLK